jgi:nicotinamidase-related amidase
MPGHPDLIDRDDLVLLVVDVQHRLAAVMERREDVVAAIVRLIRAAAIVGAPVLVTRQYPKGLGETAPEVKTSFCACGEPGFTAVLEATGRRQVAIAGMETHICVTQTALALIATGHRVHVVEDACCSRRSRDHETALARLRAQRVTVTCSESLMYEAVGRAGSGEFKRLLAVVKEG